MSNEPIEHHYNPCLWVAHWNFDYLKAIRSNNIPKESPRKQVIHSWKLKPNKTISEIVENCFFSKNANNIHVRSEYASSSFKNLYPNNESTNRGSLKEENTIVSYNIENLFSTIEDCYKDALLKAIKTGKIDSIASKTMLSFFILTQSIRNPLTWNYLKDKFSMAKESTEDISESIFNFFNKLRNSLENRDSLMKGILPLISSKWILYKTSKYLFPVSDASVLVTKDKFLIPLAPDMLLEIQTNKTILPKVTSCVHRKHLSFHRYQTFKKLTFLQSKIEIVFGKKDFFEKSFFTYYFQ